MQIKGFEIYYKRRNKASVEKEKVCKTYILKFRLRTRDNDIILVCGI